MNYYFEDFTEDNYRNLLRIAKEKFKFSFFDDCINNSQTVLWRHDLDHSVERALRIAEIEHEENVTSTFFIYLHSEFYSIFEKETINQIKKIISLGHQIGLHFYPYFYDQFDLVSLEYNISFEKHILEYLLSISVPYLSFHSPQIDDVRIDWKRNYFCEMVNVYSSLYSESYEYISDSNGYWRFKRLEDVLRNSNKDLHVLTHPEWWVPGPISPRDRIQLCIDKRAVAMGSAYDEFTEVSKRLNIK